MYTLNSPKSVRSDRVTRMETKDRYRLPYARLWIVSGIFVFIGYVLHVVGFATNYWTDFGLSNIGLWRACVNAIGCVDLGTSNSDWWKAVQALTIIGIILGFIAIIVLSVIICKPRHYKWRIVAYLCAFFAGSSVIAAIATWAAYATHLGYSFGLSTAGGGLMLIGGLILCVDLCINRGYRRTRQVRYPPPERPHYESNYPQELRAPPYDGYKKPYPVQEPPRVYERYPDDHYDRPVRGHRYEPSYYKNYKNGYDRGDRFDRYDTPPRNYGHHYTGRTTYIAFKPEYERNTGRYDYN
ncbi:hypothetical protein DPMN_112831 [Dreissena polymorpha]|uniref:Uncharacterized protein n=2 Tax=Dreissena polymorpha TaxID=45954 RepID=A0A9D4QQ40_DREPO|nr:hypothetical protein DPMN_112831 [Dreissena polymorpha]